MRFIEEIKNVRTTKSLAEKVQATIQVVRDGVTIEVGCCLVLSTFCLSAGKSAGWDAV